MSSPPGRRIAITGASGYIGRALCAALVARSFLVRRVLRQPGSPAADDTGATRGTVEDICAGDISKARDWDPIVRGVDCVVHLASPALTPDVGNPLARYREVNVEGTRQLAQSAAVAGVRRLVFLSTLKVHGERSLGRPLAESDAPHPADAYAVSKVEAEQALQDIVRATGLNVLTLRPPAVYGPGTRGNMLRLLQWIASGIPLPLASIANRRSLIGIDNLVDAILTCIAAAPERTGGYLLSDCEDVSTPDLIRRLAAALGVSARLFPCPLALLRLGGGLLGRSSDIGRLTDSLQIDASKIRAELGWQPPYSLAQGLGRMVHWYRTLGK